MITNAMLFIGATIYDYRHGILTRRNTGLQICFCQKISLMTIAYIFSSYFSEIFQCNGILLYIFIEKIRLIKNDMQNLKHAFLLLQVWNERTGIDDKCRQNNGAGRRYIWHVYGHRHWH